MEELNGKIIFYGVLRYAVIKFTHTDSGIADWRTASDSLDDCGDPTILPISISSAVFFGYQQLLFQLEFVILEFVELIFVLSFAFATVVFQLEFVILEFVELIFVPSFSFATVVFQLEFVVLGDADSHVDMEQDCGDQSSAAATQPICAGIETKC
jgi:hypothetical protein